jgi:trans-aconitate 2-methyltransferase
MRVVDLGCGTGELTKALHERVGARETLGLDNSKAMLDQATAYAGAGLTFAAGEIPHFAAAARADAWDLIYANASLQWCDEHPELFRSLAGVLAPGGQLAVQMPMNHDYPTHTVAAALAREPRYWGLLGGKPRAPSLLAPEAYAELLHALGFSRQVVRLEVYPHLLKSREEVIEWVKGTLLTYYQSRLPAGEFAAFMDDYRSRLFAVLPDQRPFFYPFKRLLLWGARSGAAA